LPLFVLGTPIGNLSDVSPRVREVLTSVDVIFAEDTRVTRKLISALDLQAPPIERYRGHEQTRFADACVERVARGDSVALVCDAGTPSVSDPGLELVRLCHERDLPVSTIAGPSAVACAISVSGFDAVPFHFLGFPPRKAGRARHWIREAGALGGTLVVYESPRRTLAFLRHVALELPDRDVCLCRELTKLHEEILRLPVADMVDLLQGRDEIRGEVTLVIGPGEPPAQKAPLETGPELRSIAAALAQRWGVPRREAYQHLLELERSIEPGR
jgi:16S rRNA (cytidine1402-2'-O)-methyltransferase